METASSISRRRPQTELTPYLGNRSGGAGLLQSGTASAHEPDAVRASRSRLPARTSSSAGASRSVATRNRLISNLRRLLSSAEEATATAVAGVDSASSQQILAIGSESKWLSPTEHVRVSRAQASLDFLCPVDEHVAVALGNS